VKAGLGMKKPQPPREPRMYLIVRSDLDTTYRVVQGAHALAKYAMEHPDEFHKWNNQFLIVLSVWNLQALYVLGEKLQNEYPDLKFSAFIEPDQDHRVTAIACYTTGEVFEGLPLAR